MNYRAYYDHLRKDEYNDEKYSRKLPHRTKTGICSACLEMDAGEEQIGLFIEEVERSPFVVLSLSWKAFEPSATKKKTGEALSKLQLAISAMEKSNAINLLMIPLSDYLPNLQKTARHSHSKRPSHSGGGNVIELIPESTWVSVKEVLSAVRNAARDAEAELESASILKGVHNRKNLNPEWISVGKKQQGQKNQALRLLASYYLHLLEETTGLRVSLSQNQGCDQVLSRIITWLRDLQESDTLLPKTYRSHIDAVLKSRQV